MNVGSGRPRRRPVALSECAVLLRPDDDVRWTTRELPAGSGCGRRQGDRGARGVPRSHKLAVRDVRAGDPVHKYGPVDRLGHGRHHRG